MIGRLAQWNSGEGFSTIRADWLARAAGLGEDVVSLADREFVGSFEASTSPAAWCCAFRRQVREVTAGDVFMPAADLRQVELIGSMMARSCDELVFAPLGGVGEIGMNLALYGFGDERRRQWIAVDFGVAFAGDELPGIDLILPDIRYLVEAAQNILGIVLTHAHEDHFGAVIDLWPRLKYRSMRRRLPPRCCGQARKRTRCPSNPGEHRPARRPFHARPVRHRTRLDGASIPESTG